MVCHEIAEQRAKIANHDNDYETAISLLPQNYGDDIFRFYQSMLNNFSDIQDVSHTGFIQTINGVTNFRAWLYSISGHRYPAHLKENRWLKQNKEFLNEAPKQTGTLKTEIVLDTSTLRRSGEELGIML